MLKIQLPKAFVHFLAAEISLAVDRNIPKNNNGIQRQHKLIQALWNFETPGTDDCPDLKEVATMDRCVYEHRGLWVRRLERLLADIGTILQAERVVKNPISLKMLHQFFRVSVVMYNAKLRAERDKSYKLYYCEESNALICAKSIEYAIMFGHWEGFRGSWTVCTYPDKHDDGPYMATRQPNQPFLKAGPRWTSVVSVIPLLPYIDL